MRWDFLSCFIWQLTYFLISGIYSVLLVSISMITAKVSCCSKCVSILYISLKIDDWNRKTLVQMEFQPLEKKVWNFGEWEWMHLNGMKGIYFAPQPRVVERISIYLWGHGRIINWASLSLFFIWLDHLEWTGSNVINLLGFTCFFLVVD